MSAKVRKVFSLKHKIFYRISKSKSQHFWNYTLYFRNVVIVLDKMFAVFQIQSLEDVPDEYSSSFLPEMNETILNKCLWITKTSRNNNRNENLFFYLCKQPAHPQGHHRVVTFARRKILLCTFLFQKFHFLFRKISLCF